MPEANLTTFNIQDMAPAELEQRRRALIQRMTTEFRGFDDENVPLALLQELAAITSALRRKTAGPPKVAKAKPAGKSPATTDDLLL